MVVYRSEEVAADPEWKEEMRVKRLTRAQEIGYADGYFRAGGSIAAKVHESGKQQSAGKALKKLEDLPAKCFKIVPRDSSGFQYHTRWRMGLSTHDIMLDGGSSVNSTTEELVLQCSCSMKMRQQGSGSMTNVIQSKRSKDGITERVSAASLEALQWSFWGQLW